MKRLMLSAAAVAVALAFSACEREVKTVETNRTIVQPAPTAEKETVKEKETVVIKPETVKEKETVVIKPTPVPGPAGPAGPEGPKGEPGKPGGDTIVVVPPPQK